MFDVPVTVAVNVRRLAAGTEALVGLMLTRALAAAPRVTLAEADVVGSAALVAGNGDRRRGRAAGGGEWLHHSKCTRTSERRNVLRSDFG